MPTPGDYWNLPDGSTYISVVGIDGDPQSHRACEVATREVLVKGAPFHFVARGTTGGFDDPRLIYVLVALAPARDVHELAERWSAMAGAKLQPPVMCIASTATGEMLFGPAKVTSEGANEAFHLALELSQEGWH